MVSLTMATRGASGAIGGGEAAAGEQLMPMARK